MDSLKVSRILHAGYIFETPSARIAFDPIFENPWSVNCYAFPPIEFDLHQVRDQIFTAVFISHYHDDHLSLKSLDLLDRKTPIYLFSVFDEPFQWLQELGFQSVHSLALGEPVEIGDITLTPRRAVDADVDCVFQIRTQGLHILNVVDAWIDPLTMSHLCKTKTWDLVLWPFQSMRELEVISPRTATPSDGLVPAESLRQIVDLQPNVVVPSSCQFRMEEWSWYNKAFFPISYASFERQLNRALPLAKVLRLDPGESILLSKTSFKRVEPLPWIQRLSEQEADYEFDGQVVPPNPQTIAHQFPSLTSPQIDALKLYCEASILEKYRNLEVLEQGFFAEPRKWSLTIYDSVHKPVNFFFEIELGQINLASEGPADWSTEITAYKLWAALHQGETLTSMYLRINDLCRDLEKVRGIDPGEDPLIRCLFSGVFGAFQENQLREIKAGKAGPQ